MFVATGAVKIHYVRREGFEGLRYELPADTSAGRLSDEVEAFMKDAGWDMNESTGQKDAEGWFEFGDLTGPTERRIRRYQREWRRHGAKILYTLDIELVPGGQPLRVFVSHELSEG